ncbi:hypothetical protein HAZT_HAZT010468 [Hyalella azteca]|uniref:Uncharacterized protein n=1 Tax=Hyalella azteca TaxID=294128 RepID=A0A6A0HAJ8_HYAAZ|nr:hypothetical protein HAZT_HAZT010468 [Hyalella azteca]
MDFSNNPFLFDDPAVTAENDPMVNPFFDGGGLDFSSVNYEGINPFSDQIGESSGIGAGLFGDASSYPIDINPFGEVDVQRVKTSQTSFAITSSSTTFSICSSTSPGITCKTFTSPSAIIAGSSSKTSFTTTI